MFSLFQPSPQVFGFSLKSNRILFQDHFSHQISMKLTEKLDWSCPLFKSQTKPKCSLYQGMPLLVCTQAFIVPPRKTYYQSKTILNQDAVVIFKMFFIHLISKILKSKPEISYFCQMGIKAYEAAETIQWF